LEQVCALLHAQVTSFLSAAAPDEVTRRTQRQTQVALGVISRALQEYE
jgi:hypothetical protein